VADGKDLIAHRSVKLRVPVAFEGEKVKHNVYPVTSHEVEVQFYSFLTSALDEAMWSKPRPDRFIPQQSQGMNCTGGRMGPMHGLDGSGKSCPPPPPGFDPRAVQPLTSRYNDYTIPGHPNI
jgi:hypothetical protein